MFKNFKIQQIFIFLKLIMYCNNFSSFSIYYVLFNHNFITKIKI